MEKLFRACAGLVCACFLSFSVSAQPHLVDIPDANFRAALKANSSLTGCFVGDQLDVDCNGVKNLMSLYVDYKNISSIEGVQYFAGLTSLSFSSNNVVTTPELPAGLRYLGCNSNQITSITSLPANLEWFDCRNNKLVNLPSLPVGLKGFSCSYNQLTSLPALPSGIDSVVCSNNKLTALPSIPEGISAVYCQNNLLTSLPSLPSTMSMFICWGNQITCLPFLPSKIWRVEADNGLCLPNIPNQYFQYVDGNTGNNIPKTLCNDLTNKNACNEYPIVSGRTYIDTDNSGTYNDGDFALPKILTTASPYGTETDLEGNYQLSFENLHTDYTISPRLPAGFTVTPSNYLLNFASYGEKLINKDFIITSSVVDLSVSFVSSGRTAPGFATSYVIVVRNNGATSQNADVTLSLDNHLLFGGSTPVVTNVGNTLSWSAGSLNPFEERILTVYCTLPASVSLGTELSSTASVNIVPGDLLPDNNTETIVQIVRGSYDPNDKQVDKGEAVTPAQIAMQEDFNYTVRFQNTGTDTAYTVVIRDTLSTMFDISTVETVSASHNYSFTMKDNALAWTFNNIKLPDSTVDKAGSNGFVRYKIKPKSTLQLNDELLNTAHIYFDFNEAIVTNTTVTKVAEKVVTVVEDKKLANVFSVYPNPSRGVFNIDFVGTETVSVDVLSVDGRTITSLGNITNHIAVDLSGRSTGVYFLRVTSADLSEVRKLILE